MIGIGNGNINKYASLFERDYLGNGKDSLVHINKKLAGTS